MKEANHRALLLLRMGIAFTFAYASVGSFLNPSAWIGYFPLFVRDIFPETLLLMGFSAIELALAVALLFWKRPAPAWIAFFMLAGITVTNLGAFDIVFRDVGLAFAALALASMSESKQKREIISSNTKED